MKCLNGKCSQGIWDCCRDCEERSECSWVCSFADDKACNERISEIRSDMRNFEIEKRFSKNRFLISNRKKNSKGETMSVELFKCKLSDIYCKSKSDDLKEYWFVRYFTKGKNNIEKIGKTAIAFNGIFEATEENAVLLLKECERRFHAEDDI